VFGVATLANNTPPNDKKHPPEGLLWGDGELRSPKRERGSSPDVKGLFTDSVIAQLPEADADLAVHDDAVSQLFGQNTRVAAPSLGPTPATPSAQWLEPGTPRGPEPRVKINLPAAVMAATGVTPARARGTSGPVTARRAPAGAMGAAPPSPAGHVAPPAAGPARPVQGTFGAAIDAAAERAAERRAPSAPLGPAADSGVTARRPPSAPVAPAAIGGEAARRPPSAPVTPGAEAPRRMASGQIEPARRPASASVAQPPVTTNDNIARRAPSGPLMQAAAPPRAASGPLDASSRPAAQVSRTPTLQPSQGGRTVEFDAGAHGSGLELETDPAQARAEDHARQGRSLPAQARPTGVDPTKSRAQAQGRSRAPEHSRPLRSGGAENAQPRVDAAELAPQRSISSGAGSGTGSDRPSQRPRTNEKRAQARREGRRKAAKHLPPPPTTAPKRRWNAARVTLATFAGVLGVFALALIAAASGWLPLPPSAAVMLGLGQASLARVDEAKQGKAPNLVMPKAPAGPVERPAVVRVDTPVEVVKQVVAVPTPPESPTMPTTTTTTATTPETAEAEATAAAEGSPQENVGTAGLLAAGRARLRAGDAPGAAALLTKVVAQDPDDHHAIEELVRAWIAMRRGEDALKYAQQIVKKRPKRAAYRLLEGDARRLIGDAAGAANAFREALRLEPNNREAKQKLGL
jgi:hypothetical protein